MNKHFTKEYNQIACLFIYLCSTSLVTKEMQFKTTMNLHNTPTKLAKIRKIGKWV